MIASAEKAVVPFFRPSLGAEEAAGVQRVLESGWLTTGKVTKDFESAFTASVGAKHAIALNSATAALHLAVEALGLGPGQGVLVPTLTFAATAEVVRYLGAVPILVDCRPDTFEIDFNDAQRKKRDAMNGSLLPELEALKVTGVMPVHVGGLIGDIEGVHAFAKSAGLWIVEDAAHAFPAAWHHSQTAEWVRCGQASADVTCFSFYANKTITTGEGGMAVTDNDRLAERIRLMSLHGLSKDAWGRYSGNGTWDYKIVAPGFKYNLTDVAAAIGLAQLRRAEDMRIARQAVARRYMEAFKDVEELTLPLNPSDRIHSWHLFPIRLHLDKLKIDRNEFIEELKALGVATSVHWRPLHLHPYYQETFGWKPEQFPVATAEWQRLISLPIFPGMTEQEIAHVISCVRDLCARHAKLSVHTA